MADRREPAYLTRPSIQLITISQGSEKNIPAPHQGDFHLKIPIKLNATCLLKPQILESQAPTRPFPESISHVKKPADDYLR